MTNYSIPVKDVGGVADPLTGDPYGGGSRDESHESRGESSRIYLSLNKVRKNYVTFINPKNGQVVIIDQDKNRLLRLQRRVHDWANLISDQPGHLVMYMLSYAKVDDWRKNDIRDFMLSIRKYLGDNLNGYAWVAEIQKRKAVHYHVLLHVTEGTFIPKPDESGLWVHGKSHVDWRVKTPFYIVKYTGKEHQKDFQYFPKGIRVFSTWLKDKKIALVHRYNGLKTSEKAAVDTDGWQALKFWRKQAVGQSEWILADQNEDLDEALLRIQDIFSNLELVGSIPIPWSTESAATSKPVP